MKECPECGRCYDDDRSRCPEDTSPLDEHLHGPRLMDKKYLLERCLGRGGMGAVYQATHQDLQKTFALKLILSDVLANPAYLSRFRVEAKALGKLQHPNIVLVTDYGIDPRDSGIPYLVMEYLKGTTLLEYLRKKKFLAPEEAIPLLESIAAATDYAHGCGILHRDLKLQNIFLADHPSGAWQAKILDFGLARITGDIAGIKAGPRSLAREEAFLISPVSAGGTTLTLAPEQKNGQPLSGEDRPTQAGSIMGTLGYMAPEIWKGLEATPASDIFSFGVMAYEILTGKPPFEVPGLRGIHPPLFDIPPPSAVEPAVPEELNEPILASLRQDPKDRPGKAMDMILGLRRALTKYKYRVWRAQKVPGRIKLAGMLTLLLVLFFWLLRAVPVFQNIENFLVDVRFWMLPSRAPDERIIIVSIDEATLQQDPTLLAEKADNMGFLLQRVMESHPKGLAIDLLLPERWNQSESFIKLVLKNQAKLVLAGYVTKEGTILGMEILRGFIMAALGSPERADSLFGFLNVEPDADGRLRRTHLGFRSREGLWLRSMPAKAFQMLAARALPDSKLDRPLWIDYSIAWDKFARISWKDLPSVLEKKPAFFSDKMILVGGEYEGSQDFHRIPQRFGGGIDELSGLAIQALTINTLLEGGPIHEGSGLAILVLMAASLLAFSLMSFIWPKTSSSMLLLISISTGYLLFSVILFRLGRQIWPIGLPIFVWLTALSVVLWIRRRLSFVSKEVD